LEREPSQAVTLADAAVERFRQVETSAERELAAQRQAATASRKRAQEIGAEEHASETYAAAEEVLRKGDVRGQDWVQRKKLYGEAKTAFDKAAEEAEEQQKMAVAKAAQPSSAPADRVEARQAAPAPPAEPSSAQVPEPRPAPPTIAAVAAVPTIAPLPPKGAAPKPSGALAAPPGPMPADLAASIQAWLRDTCQGFNRSLARSGGARAKCEDLVVIDRRDRSQVRITYSMAFGSLIPEGIRWDTPAQRSATLDCSASSCRCVSGDGC
jgi:hypothetical protein